jgi:hypothetical protein
LRPVEALALHAPAVDDIADKIDGRGVMLAQEIDQQLGLAVGCAEMDV